MEQQQFFDFEAREHEDAERQNLLTRTPGEIIDRALQEKWIDQLQLDGLWREYDHRNRDGERSGKDAQDYFTRWMQEDLKESLIDTILVLRSGGTRSVASAERISAQRFRVRHGTNRVSLKEQLEKATRENQVFGR